MTKKNDLKDLTLLGKGPTRPQRTRETFPNQHPHRRYTVKMETDEFTAVCPITGQPDFAHIRIEYIPKERNLESKSLKLCILSFRDEGNFDAHVTNMILDELVDELAIHS